MYAFNKNQKSITNVSRSLTYIGDVDNFSTYHFGELVDGSRSEKYNEREFSASMNFICDWKSRFQVAAILSQSIYPIPEGEFNDQSFSDCYFDPICIDMSISVFAEPGEAAYSTYNNLADPKNHAITYTKAKIACQYKAFAKPSIFNVDVTYNPQIEARTLNNWGFYWESDRSQITEDQAPFIMDFSLGIDLGFKNITELNDLLWKMDGKVFNFAFTDKILDKTFAPGTILFGVKSLARSLSQSRDIDDRLWTVNVSLMYNPIGWNKHRRPSSLINYGDSMFTDNIVREDGSVFQSYPELELSTGSNFELFKLITDPNATDPFK